MVGCVRNTRYRWRLVVSVMYFEISAALVYWEFRLPGTSEVRVGFPVPGQARRTSIVVGKRVAYAE